MPTVKNLPYGDIGASFTSGANFESSSSHTSLQSFRTDALVLSTPSLSTGYPSMSRAPSATRYCFAWGCPYDPAPWTTITLSADSSSKYQLDFFSGATSAIALQQVSRASTFSVSGSPSLMVMAAPPSFTMTSTVPSAGGATRVTLRNGADFLGAFSFFRFSPCVRMVAFSAPPTLRFRSIDLTIEFSRLDKMPHQP